MKTIIASLFFINFALAQSVYEIPFPEGTGASQGNVIELSVANNSDQTAEGVSVSVTNIPDGISFNEKTVTIPVLKAKEELTASFTFSVGKTAQVKKEQTLNFTITDKTGQSWNKEIKIKIAPPTTFELYQNYPNPFNPTTAISYLLMANCQVQLMVFDLLGREVMNLVNEQQEAGYHQVAFNAQNLSSGIYFYQLTATDEKNKSQILKKKMILLR